MRTILRGRDIYRDVSRIVGRDALIVSDSDVDGHLFFGRVTDKNVMVLDHDCSLSARLDLA